MSSRQPCQGGFCHLHLPDNNVSSSCSTQTLSKREKRVLKSIQRDRATQLLQWTLREDEYFRLEVNGDLVRLRACDCYEDGVGYWVKHEHVCSAKKEHRPELARLAFAEFTSQKNEDDVSHVSYASNDCAPVMVKLSSQSNGFQDDVLVCGICSTVYYLLEQARGLLNSYDAMQQSNDETASLTLPNIHDGRRDNNNGSKYHQDLTVTINHMDSIPNKSLEKFNTEGLYNKKLTGVKQQPSPIQTRSSFHDPLNVRSDTTSSVTFVERKSCRKQMEENSKIHILVAESDYATLKLARCLLEKEGFKVDTASNGSDCIKLLEKQTHSILLINENLPVKDAASVGRWIRKREELEKVTVKMKMLVIVQRILTAHYHDYDELEVSGFLSKPLESVKMLPSIKKIAMQHLDDQQLAAESEKAKRVVVEKQFQVINTTHNVVEEQVRQLPVAQSIDHTQTMKRRGKRMERNAQINVARMIRGINARRKYQAVLQKRECGATKIQSMYRMHSASLLRKYHEKRRESSIIVQKHYRGHRDRKKAALERDKYIFSRSQKSEIDNGRQLLTEHEIHAIKIQSELTLLNEEKHKVKKQIEFHLSQISHFDQTISDLEKKMHNTRNFERETVGEWSSLRGPLVMDKEESAKLIDCRKQTMKFRFRMSLTYFSSLKLIKAIQRVGINDTLTHQKVSPLDKSQHEQHTPSLHVQQFDILMQTKVESVSKLCSFSFIVH